MGPGSMCIMLGAILSTFTLILENKNFMFALAKARAENLGINEGYQIFIVLYGVMKPQEWLTGILPLPGTYLW